MTNTSPRMNIRLKIELMYVILFSILLVACNSINKQYPKSLEHAIDLFYMENKNDSVLLLLNSDEFAKQTAGKDEYFVLKNVFTAGALCEKGFPGKAFDVINQITIDDVSERTAYYYYSILGLIEFRLQEFEKSYKILLNLTEQEEAHDERALALNQRILGRIMFAYSDYNMSLEWFFKSKNNFENANLLKSAAINNKFIANACIDIGLFDEAPSYLISSEKVFSDCQDFEELFYVYIVLVDLYIHKLQTDSANYYIAKAEACCSNNYNKQMHAYTLLNQGEVEKIDQRYPEAIQIFNNLLNLGENYQNARYTRQASFLNLADIYNLLNEPLKARDSARKALATLEGAKRDDLKFAIYNEISKSYANSDVSAMNLMKDSAVMCLESFHKSQKVNLIKLNNTQLELNLARHNAEHIRIAAKKLKRNLTLIILLLSVGVLTLFVLSEKNREKNKMLKALLKKNLQLLDEERLNRVLIQEQQQKKSTKNLNDDDRSNQIYDELVDWLENDQNFKRKDITLELVAKELNTNRDYLSRSINDHNIRFPDLINRYRVEEAVRIFSDTNDFRNKYSLQIISSEVGFNSYSVFVDSFRKHTGLTPVEFKKHTLEN